MSVCMELSRILVRENAQAHVVELREVGGERIVPIIIGQNEIAAIERGLLGQVPPRPMTHELLANVIEVLGASLERVQITDLQDQTFFARLVLRQGDQVIHVDCRPSDALALIAGGGEKVEVAESVVEQVSMGDHLPPGDPMSMDGMDDPSSDLPPASDEDDQA